MTSALGSDLAGKASASISPSPPRCTATTKAGEPCSAAPMTGRETCMAHADLETRKAVGFVAEAGAAGRPPKPKRFEVWREKVEADFEKWTKPYVDALEATKDDGSADHVIRMKASDAVLDRAYGKPTQRTELSGPDGGAVPLWLQVVAPQEAATGGMPPGFEMLGLDAERMTTTSDVA